MTAVKSPQYARADRRDCSWEGHLRPGRPAEGAPLTPSSGVGQLLEASESAASLSGVGSVVESFDSDDSLDGLGESWAEATPVNPRASPAMPPAASSPIA